MTNDRWREQITDDVIRISLRYVNGFVNSYLVLGADGPRLIDAGPLPSQGVFELESHLAELGVRIVDLREILLTHAHPDHVGAVALLAALSGARIMIHHREVSQGAARLGFTNARPDIEWLLDQGCPETLATIPSTASDIPPQIEVLPDDGLLEFGPLRLRLIHTPGHSPGLLCFMEDRHGLLFSTDHLLRTATPIAIRTRSSDDPVGDYLASLEKIAGLRPKLTLPGHGRSIANFEEAIVNARQAQLTRLSDVHRAVADGARTALDVAIALGWQAAAEPTRIWLAIARTSAYLQHLEGLDLVRHEGLRPKLWFSAD